ncbi:hypothetical protein BSZ21_02370 [Bradyrhizobium canariense]|nr:hypothetical protein BSZ21_02370 [Bradyrhizobium canariense]
MQKRCRFKQTTSLQDRIAQFTETVRRQAAVTADRKKKDALLQKLRAAETAANLERQLSSLDPLHAQDR